MFLSLYSKNVHIQNQADIFKSLLLQIQRSTDLKKKEEWAASAVHLANFGSTGYHSSDIIEKVYTDIAQQHSVPLSPDYVADTFLHVMTEAYRTGGHTRVVERWIESALPHQQHSVVMIRESEEGALNLLQTNTAATGGSLILLNQNQSNLEKALELRILASRYQHIILHVHMNDTIPLMAFGTEEFKRPIIFYNHADHRFWLGCSIADVVVELRDWGIELSKQRRAYNAPYFKLGIPLKNDAKRTKADKQEARDKLHIPQDALVITTVGSFFKYKPLLHLDFIPIARKLLQADNRIRIIAIGPSYDTLPDWRLLHDEYQERFQALGNLPPDTMFQYLACSDLSIDSYPMGGGTALIDAVTSECPVLSLECPTGQLDYVHQSGIYCKDEDILVDRALKLLRDKQAAKENCEGVYNAMIQTCGTASWKAKLPEIYNMASTHKLHPFQTPAHNLKAYSLLDLEIEATNAATYTRRKAGFLGLWERQAHRYAVGEKKEIILFNLLRLSR